MSASKRRDVRRGQVNRYILQFGLNGTASPTVRVSNDTINEPTGAQLTALRAATTRALSRNADRSRHRLVRRRGRHQPRNLRGQRQSADPNAPDGYDLGYYGNLGDVTTQTLSDVPADGTPFYVTIYWYDGSWYWNRWQITITPAPDRRAIARGDVNRILTQSQIGIAGATEISDGDEDNETVLDPQVLVLIHKTIDTAGNDRFVFDFVEEELHGVIVEESAEGEDDDYSDERYWVQLSRVSNSGDADEAVTLEDATDAMERVITVTNHAEVVDHTHRLIPGTPVMVRTARGGTKPWITRYVMNVGGTGGGAFFLAKLMNNGPEGEADYDDGRYWVQEVAVTAGNETDPLIMSLVPVANGGRWVTAHNLVEYGAGANDTGLHNVRRFLAGISAIPQRYVWIREVKLDVGKRYVFDTYPGQMIENAWGFIVTCLASSCPVGAWYRMDGPGFRVQEDPPNC
jgi:hypothetical protein